MKNSPFLIFSILFLSILFSPALYSQTNAQLKTQTDAVVDSAVRSYMLHSATVGLSIGIYRNGKTFTYHYGETASGNHVLPTDHSLYSIASISKTFAGLVLADAILEKKVKPEDDIRQWLSGDYPNLAWRGHPITLIDLLNHRSGLPFLIPDVSQRFGDTTLTTTDIANLIYAPVSADEFYTGLHAVVLDTLPGTRFRYSNAAVILLGYILEKIYQEPYERLLQKKILGPLAMHDTKIRLVARDSVRFVKAYEDKGHSLPEGTDALGAAAGIKSTVADMLKYIRWNAEENVEVVRLSHRRAWTHPDSHYYTGMNWQILSSGNARVIWQEGNLPGFNSYCVIYPERGLGIVVLTNESDRFSSPKIEALVNAIMKFLDAGVVSLP